jgi:HK97 family phage major capsid protein
MNAIKAPISLADRAELVTDAVELLLGIVDVDEMGMYVPEMGEVDNDIDDADMDRCVEVYEDTVIICTAHAYWQAAYTLDEATGAVTIAPQSEWQQVENVWTAVSGAVATKTGARHSSSDAKLIQNIHDHAVALGAVPPAEKRHAARAHNGLAYIKALTAETATVAGYGVIFGGADLSGESFAPDTDYMLDLAPTKLVFYDHTLGSVKHAIGKTVSVEPDEYGLWVEAELDRHKTYVDQVLQLVKQGAIGWSSGSVGHLTRREGKSITQWPIVEMSLTPTPAEPRTLGIEIIKSLSATNPSFAVFLPETGRTPVVQETKANDEDAPDLDSIQEENEMPTTEEITALVETAVTKAFAPVQTWLDGQPVKSADIALPMMNSKTALGDDEIKAHAHYIRTNDDGGIKHLKASSNNPMTEGSNTAGGYAVPTGMYNQIVAKLREDALYPKIGVRQIPGKGLTVNVPIEGAKDGAFVLTAEGSSSDRDAPVLGQAPMTLAKYTKRIELSWELIEDEDAQLMSFLSNFIGQGMAKTHNTLLITEALAGGTLGVAWGNPIVAANIPSLVYALPQGYETNAVWIMKKSVEGTVRGFTGNYFQFIPTPVDGPGALSRRELFGFPLYNSEAMAAQAASAKSAIFGNFNYMGMRMAPDITYLNDPYSGAITGQLRQHYWFRTVYKTLQAEAILYAQQGT